MHPHYQNHFPVQHHVTGIVQTKLDAPRIFPDVTTPFAVYSGDRYIHSPPSSHATLQYNFVQQQQQPLQQQQQQAPIHQFQKKPSMNFTLIPVPTQCEPSLPIQDGQIMANLNDKHQRNLILVPHPQYYQQQQQQLPSFSRVEQAIPIAHQQQQHHIQYITGSSIDTRSSTTLAIPSQQNSPIHDNDDQKDSETESEGKSGTRSYQRRNEQEKDVEPWSMEEDKLLLSLYDQMGSKWSSMTSSFTNRTRIQLKTRHKSICRAKTRMWTSDEDSLLIEKCKDHGQGTNWADIVKYFPKRTKNSLRVRYRELTNTRFRIHKTPNLGSPFQALFDISMANKDSQDSSIALVSESNSKKRKIDNGPKTESIQDALECTKLSQLQQQPQQGVVALSGTQSKIFAGLTNNNNNNFSE